MTATSATPHAAQSVTLALDTATPWLVLGLRWQETVQGGGTVWRELERVERIERAHAERLPAEVAALFEAAGLPLQAGRIVVGTGPGSYTGVRVGASYALALAQVWGARVWGAQLQATQLLGVPTLAALVDAGALAGGQAQAVALDARKGNVYGAVYSAGWKEIRGAAKYAREDFAALAAELGATLREAGENGATPSGLSLLHAADILGAPEPEQRLSYL